MDYKDICVTDKQVPVHQLNKLNEKGTKREDFFPISVVQAIFDKTGIRLDAIISSFNYLFLPWKGTKEATRLQVVGLMRRKSLVICYRDLDDKVYIEYYNSNDRGDEEWQKDKNWVDFCDMIVDIIKDILENLDDYPDIYNMIKQIIEDAATSLVNQWLEDNATSIINDYLSKLDLSSQIQNAVNNYFNSDNFKQLIEDILNQYFEDNVDDKLNERFESMETFIKDNERVIANALARHETAINILQNT